MVRGQSPPQRTCLGCRKVKDQSLLTRFVRSPDGEVVADVRGRLPGRGAYLCNSSKCFELAVRTKQFERTFKSSCRMAEASQLIDQVVTQRLDRLKNLLGMARKSANVVAGSSAVSEALNKSCPPMAIVMAQDISPKIGEKIMRKASDRNVIITRLFTKSELGQILGRAERSVVGLLDGKLAATFLHDLHRYQEISGES